MNVAAYSMLMFFPKQSGGWGMLVEYELNEDQRDVQRRSGLQPLRRRCEMVGGFDDWRLHVDFGLPNGTDTWSVRSACWAKRSPDIAPAEFRDWLRSRKIAPTLLLDANAVATLLTTPPVGWSALWRQWRERAGGDSKD